MRALLILALLTATARAAPADLTGFAFDQRPGATLPLDAPLRDEAGRAVTLRQVGQGRPVILALGYFHCPNLCGVVRDDLFNALSQARLAAGRDYDIVAVSIDPAEGAVDAARAKADDMARYSMAGAEVAWHFLTGPAESLDAVQSAIGFRSRYDTAAAQFLHPSGLTFITPAGAVATYLLGIGYTPSDIEAGVRDAAAARVSRASPILLLCFHFDEVTGRYSLAITKLIRWAAGLTALGIGVSLFVAHRRQRPA